MSISNTLLVVDALLGVLEAKSKIESMLLVAKSENRDISDEEILALNALNIKKSIELEDLIKQKLEEYK